MAELTAEEYSEWLQHPVTREFFKVVREERDGIGEQVLSGQLLGSENLERAVIAVQVYDSILNTEFGEESESDNPEY